MTLKVEIPNIHDLAHDYLAGESLKHLSDRTGYTRHVLLARFTELGIPLRGQSEAERTKWVRMVGERRTRQLEKAWLARRGSHDTLETKVQRARTRQARQTHVGPGARELADALRAQDFSPVLERAWRNYNIDLALEETLVAIEIGHPRHRGESSFRDKTESMLDAGWAVLCVNVDSRPGRRLNLGAVADYIVTLAKRRSRPETRRGEYLVIRGDAQPVAIGGNYF